MQEKFKQDRSVTKIRRKACSRRDSCREFSREFASQLAMRDVPSHPVYGISSTNIWQGKRRSFFSVDMFSRSTMRPAGSQRQLITFWRIIYRDSLSFTLEEQLAGAHKRRGAGSRVADDIVCLLEP